MPAVPLTGAHVAPPAALIVARDPMSGALIGSLVAVAGFRPAFPAPTEAATAAIDRVRPSVILVDCDSEDEEECAVSVAAHGGTVILFSPSRRDDEVRATAIRHGTRYFVLPIAWTEFRRLLHSVFDASRPA